MQLLKHKISKTPIHNELNSNNHQIKKIENKGNQIESKGMLCNKYLP